MIKIDELNKATNAVAMQGTASFLGTPFTSDIPWEDGSPKSKYSKIYGGAGGAGTVSFTTSDHLALLQSKQQTTPMSHAIPSTSHNNH